MNTFDLVERIAAEHALTEVQARAFVSAMFIAIVGAAVTGEEVALSGFGRFKVTNRAARQGRNPATGGSITIPASRKLTFAPAKSVREQINTKSARTIV